MAVDNRKYGCMQGSVWLQCEESVKGATQGEGDDVS